MLGSFKLFLKFISEIHGLVRWESPCVLNTQRRHKPESEVFPTRRVSLLEWGWGEDKGVEEPSITKEDFKIPRENVSIAYTELVKLGV